MGVGAAPFARRLRVLIVDEDASGAEVLRACLSRIPSASVELATAAEEAMNAIAREPVDVVVADVRVAERAGFAMLEMLRRAIVPTIVLTEEGEVHGATEALQRGALDCLVKPVDLARLRWAVERAAVERAELGADGPLTERAGTSIASSQRPSARALLGAASSIVAMLEAMERIAQSSAPVLVSGETGTGKDLVASLVHAKGPRRNRPYVAVNTTAIPATLLESELFGHVRGAFTGATQARRGLLVEADGGTLFLDEIGDMPLALQGTLLRVIETGEVRAVGSDRGRRVDVRFIAATHRNLPALVQAGKFREDLYYRLDVLSVQVPPLRERRGDIPILAAHFLELARTRMAGARVERLSPGALGVLMRGPWPGNVRQLAATIERLVVLGKSPVIEESDLAFLERASHSAEAGWPGASFELCSLKALSERYIGWVLAQSDNDKARAAAILGVDISTLYRWQRRGPLASDPRAPRKR